MTEPHPINLLIVDDSELVRLGLKTLLEAHSRTGPALLRVIGEADSVASALTETTRLKPDVVLLDIRLPDGSGLDACRQLVASHEETKILILTSFLDDNLVYEAMSSGAHGYLLKEINALALCRAIVEVASGKFILDPKITSRVRSLLRHEKPSPGEENRLNLLSPQELRVMALVAEGKTNKEIGEQMELSEKTVKNYLSNTFEKLKISRRSQAAVLYSESRGVHKK